MRNEIRQYANYFDNEGPVLEKALYDGEAIVPDREEDGPVTRKMVVGWINEFIRSSYRLNSNPLPHLRKFFPKFQWTFLNTNLGDGTYEQVAFAKMCYEADFIWDAYNFTCFVAAYRQRRLGDIGVPWKIWGGPTFTEAKVPCHEFRASRVKDTDGKVATDV